MNNVSAFKTELQISHLCEGVYKTQDVAKDKAMKEKEPSAGRVYSPISASIPIGIEQQACIETVKALISRNFKEMKRKDLQELCDLLSKKIIPLKSEQVFVEIAGACLSKEAQEVGWKLSPAAIKEGTVLIEAAKFLGCISGNLLIKEEIFAAGNLLFQYMKEFGITGETAHSEIALYLVKIHPSFIWKNLHQFDIRHEPTLTQIAKTAVLSNPSLVAESLEKCGLLNEQSRLEVAQAAAKEDATVFFDTVQFYNFKNEASYAQVVKIMLFRNMELLLQRQRENLRDWGGSDVEFSDFGVSIQKIMSFPITTSQYLREIALMIAQTDLITQTNVDAKSELLAFIENCHARDSGKALRDNVFNLLVPSKQLELSQFENEILVKGDMEKLKWLEAYQILCEMYKLSEKEKTALLPYAKLISNSQRVDARLAITYVLFNNWQPLLSSLQSVVPLKIEQNSSVNVPYMHIYLAALRKNSTLAPNKWNTIYSIVQSKAFRDYHESYGGLVGTLEVLVRKPLELSFQEKDILIQYVFAEKGMMKMRINVLKAIFFSRHVELLSKSIEMAMSQTESSVKGKNDGAQQKENVEKEGVEKCTEMFMLNLERELDKLSQYILLNQLFADEGRQLTRIFPEQGKGRELDEKFLKEAEALQKKYAEKVQLMRQPSAFAVLVAKLNGLPENEWFKLLLPLRDFLMSVLDGKYEAWRYKESEKSHFTTIFKDQPHRQKEWQAGGLPQSLDSLLKLDKEAAGFNSADYFKEEVHKQRSTTVVTVCKDLEQFLSNPANYTACCQNVGRKIRQAMEVMEKETKTAWSQQTKYDSKNKYVRDIYALKLEADVIKLFGPKKSFGQQVEEIKQLLPRITVIFGKQDKYFLALQNLQIKLEAVMKVDDLFSYRIVDTDEYEDLLLSGTEVVSSCQSIHNENEYLKCLLNFMIDPKYRLIAVKQGKTIVARSWVRLLWDPIKRVPVLFQEKIYKADNIPPEVLKGINAMCEKRAKALGIDLVSAFSAMVTVPNGILGPKREIDEKLYGGSLTSLGSRAPYEYVDAARINIVEGGRYVIDNQWIRLGPVRLED